MASISEEQKETTKRRILVCAVDMFAKKGFTETSIAEIASAVGIKASSLYYHFPQKEDILIYMLEDYAKSVKRVSFNQHLPSMINDNPTTDDLVDCLQFDFTKQKDPFYANVLAVTHREQHRNKLMHGVVRKQIMNIEVNVARIFAELKAKKVIRQDADPKFWGMVISSLSYHSTCRRMLGIGVDPGNDADPDIRSQLKWAFGLVLELYKLPENA